MFVVCSVESQSVFVRALRRVVVVPQKKEEKKRKKISSLFLSSGCLLAAFFGRRRPPSAAACKVFGNPLLTLPRRDNFQSNSATRSSLHSRKKKEKEKKEKTRRWRSLLRSAWTTRTDGVHPVKATAKKTGKPGSRPSCTLRF